ncbi:MAG: T9SS type A sorting domain-containing protein [Bacteroidales bacterium]|nr:T9SS type A sorting domain-containing protein [Bacteroidales bacterium]MBN2699101.1 T9SS type A sorting domain-containing protein [Bacteroidales bacterium]
MKHNFFIPAIAFIILLPFTLSGQPAWQAQTSPVQEDLVTVSFASTTSGWAASATGTIIHTSDGGKSWTVQHTQTDYYPEKLFFTDTLTGWMVGNTADKYTTDRALVFKTEDGGASWKLVLTAMGAKLYDIFFVNDTMGWTVGYYLLEGDTIGLRLHTTNSGKEWKVQDVGISVATIYSSIHFRDTNIGDLCGPGPVLMHTNTGGRTSPGWALNIIRISQPVYDLVNAGDVYGCMVGEEGKIIFTKDKWVQFAVDYNYPDGDTLWSVDAIDTPAFWIVGEAGTIIFGGVSAIFGLQIQDQSLDIPQNLYEVDALDDSHVWAVGQAGTILHFGQEGGSGTPVVRTEAFTFFPNPASGQVLLNRHSVEAGQAHIFNLQGKMVRSIALPAGQTQVILSLEGVAPGHYIVQSDGERKMLVIIR